MAVRVMIFKRFERFWHWAQALLILVLLMSGFEIHGSYDLLGFEDAVTLHRTAAWSLVTLWIFTIFWHFTTGEWQQYIPTLKKVDAMIRYYLLGIFIRAPHPFRQTMLRKHNPLQRLAYLFLWVVISPMIWLTGWAYLFYARWGDWGLDRFLVLGHRSASLPHDVAVAVKRSTRSSRTAEDVASASWGCSPAVDQTLGRVAASC